MASMSREEILKRTIKSKFGSVLKFSEFVGIPESSIRNIFTRGIDSVNAGTLVTICKALNLDLEALISGSFSVRPNAQKDLAYINYANTINNSDITPIDPTHFHRIPILGYISAGLPLYAEEHIEGYTYTDLNGGAEYFALKVKGDSMNALGINDGYQIIVRRQDEVENGEVAVVMVGDENATVKRFYATDSTVTLMPQSTNPTHQPQLYDLAKTSIKVLGKVVKVEFSL